MSSVGENPNIYDALIPHLASAGRRVVSLDFFGFGASDKPDGVRCSFDQQLGDLEAVVDALGLDRSSPSATMPAVRPPSTSL
jgi:haloalkane dehalogenase